MSKSRSNECPNCGSRPYEDGYCHECGYDEELDGPDEYDEESDYND